MTDTTTDDRAKQQAMAQMANIEVLVHRLQHVEDCKNDHTCTLDDGTLTAALDYGRNDHVKAREDYHDYEKTMETIQDDPIHVEVRSGWHIPGAEIDSHNEEYNILFCTGGPAVRIIGGLDEYNEPQSATLEYQDWGTPWTELKEANEDTLLQYANCFYFGEF